MSATNVFKCLLCEKAWSNEGAVVKHIKTIHGKENVEKADYKKLLVTLTNKLSVPAVQRHGDCVKVNGALPAKIFHPPLRQESSIKQEPVEEALPKSNPSEILSRQIKVTSNLEKPMVEKLSMLNFINAPHLKSKVDFDTTKSTSQKENIVKVASKENVIKKPVTAFIQWSKTERAKLIKQFGKMPASEMSKELTKRWAALDFEIKKSYQDKYKEEKGKYNKDIETISLNNMPMLNSTSDCRSNTKEKLSGSTSNTIVDSTKILNPESRIKVKRKRNQNQVNRNKSPKKQKFGYFEGFKMGNISLVANGSIILSTSDKKSNSESNSDNTTVQSSNEKIIETASTSSSVQNDISELNLEKNDFSPSAARRTPVSDSKLRKSRKPRAQCEMKNCVPCSITENCNKCVYCLNRSKLKQKCEKRQCPNLNPKVTKKVRLPPTETSPLLDAEVNEKENVTEEISIMNENLIHQISNGQSYVEDQVEINIKDNDRSSPTLIEEIINEIIAKSVAISLKEKRNRKKVVHTKAMIYSCNKCGKGYKQHKSKIEHERKCEKLRKVKRDIVCEICRVALSDKRSYRRHKKLHNKQEKIASDLQCSECNIIFSSKNKLKSHMTKSHTEGTDITESGLKMCPVEGCEFRHLKEAFVKRHVTKEHRSENKEKIKCSICPYECLSKGGLNKHLKAVHTVLTTGFVEDALARSEETLPEISGQSDFSGDDSFSEIFTENPMKNIDDLDMDLDFNLSPYVNGDSSANFEQNVNIADPLERFLDIENVETKKTINFDNM